VKEGAIALLNGARGLFFEADDFLPLHLGISKCGLTDAPLDARIPPGFLRLPGRGKRQCYC
jgi:hypothetical protein